MSNIPNIIRKEVYRRDGFRCALCDDYGGLQIHHCIRKSQGGTDDPMNLITLCWKCHAVAHGVMMPEYPDYFDQAECQHAVVEYLADFYAPDWWPWGDAHPWRESGG